MKKFILVITGFFILQTGFSYSWGSVGPPGIKAKDIILMYEYYPNPAKIILVDSGFYIEVNFEQYEYIPIKVIDICPLSTNTIAILISEGSYSDGIYSFNLETHEMSVIEYCIYPNFIEKFGYNGPYYVGCEDCLIKSSNGVIWESVPFFNGKNCVGMVADPVHKVVNVSEGITHIYFSDNSGNDWFESSNNPQWISHMAFYEGKLFGVFPDHSNSSGLWVSEDFGDNWEISFYSDSMSDVFSLDDVMLLISWESSFENYEGIAIYEPESTSELTFLNEGLPNTNINRIKGIELIDYFLEIYVCTDSGIYVCGDYYTGIDKQRTDNSSINIYPNPVTKTTTINISKRIDNIIYIYNNQGVIVDIIKIENNQNRETTIKWNKGDLPAGIYYLVVKTKKGTLSEKFIIL